MTTYRWKPKSRMTIPAQVAGEELERISQLHNGRLIATDIVEASRDSAAPLHSHFEWNDSIAAEKHREEQARGLVRQLVVTFPTQDEDEKEIRAFVSVTQDEDRSYQGIVHAMSQEDLRQQVVARAWKDLEIWRARYDHLSELASIFEAMESTQLAAE